MIKRFIKIVLFVLVFGYIAVGVLLYSFQEKLLYHPTADINTSYSGVVLHQDGADVYVHVLNTGHKNAILYFGGNGESMALSSDYIARQFPGFTCYLMDYRGYGGSNGKPSQKGIFSDALALYDLAKSKHEKISVGGRSLGTGVAVYVASKREVSKLVLVTPYDSIASIAQGRYPIYPISLLLKDRYNSLNCVHNIKAKTLIVLAENDKVIPRKNSQNLIDAFRKEQLKVDVIKNRGHNDISNDGRYYKIMQEFIGNG